MVFRIDRYRVQVCRSLGVKIRDTLVFVEDPGFLEDFTECGLNDDDLETIQLCITCAPNAGEIVPVTKHVRDAVYDVADGDAVFVRYVYLPPPANIALMLTAYRADESYSMTFDEAEEVEAYIEEQIDYFSRKHTR